MQNPASSLEMIQQHPYCNLHMLRCGVNQASSHAPAQKLSPLTPKMSRDGRVRFALFVKILFKRLEESGEHALWQRAKALLTSVTTRNKQGDPGCSPLIDALETKLRAMVGEAQWRRSHLLMRLYMSRNRHILPSSTNTFHKISYAA